MDQRVPFGRASRMVHCRSLLRHVQEQGSRTGRRQPHRAAAGPEVIAAIARARAEFHPVWEAMSDEERVRWIIGE